MYAAVSASPAPTVVRGVVLRAGEKKTSPCAQRYAPFAPSETSAAAAPRAAASPRGLARVGGVGKGGRFCAVAAQQRRRGVQRQAQRLPGGIDDALCALFAREADGCGVKAGVCAVGQRAAGGQQVAGAQQAVQQAEDAFRGPGGDPSAAVERKLLRAGAFEVDPAKPIRVVDRQHVQPLLGQ